jgi:CBS domain-containing protein
MIVKELLESKGHEVVSLEADRTVEAAIRVMTERKISAVLVTRNSAPVGIFTERDVVRSYVREGERFHAVPLERIMTADVIVAEPDEDLCNVMSVMIEKGIRHVPVSEKGKIVGMLSIRDVVKTQVGKLKTEIHHLKDYLSGI